MKNFLAHFLANFLWIILKLRYSITVKGLDKLNKNTLNRPGGILFLPNHPAVFIDPVLGVIAPFPKFKLRPMVVEYMYYTPVINWVMRLINALPVPNFDISSNSLKRKRNREVFHGLIEDLKKGDNFLIYPSGRLKFTNLEIIGGASGIHTILQESPEANIVLVRIKGLWGSSFSRAQTGKTPSMFKTILIGIKNTLKNLLFFNPRRHVVIEFEPAPADFPWKAPRVELNRWLENYYNRPDGMSPQQGKYPGESLMLVRNSIWSKELPETKQRETEENKAISLADIPPNVKQKIISKIAELQDIPEASVKPEMNLSSDLGMDSLAIAELVVFLQDQFDIEAVPAIEMTTVGKVMAIAHKQIHVSDQFEEEEKDITKWSKRNVEMEATVAPGATFPEVFLNVCAMKKHDVACGDARSGLLKYSDLKMRAILLAEKIRQNPEKYIGIMLPASVASSVVVSACHLAGKVPVMINWTIGPRHLEAVLQVSGIKKVYTSWAFLDRLHHAELGPIEDLMIPLEDLRTTISLKDKIKALIRSKQSTKSIMKHFGIENITKDDEAVVLFTSGTESMPKGVPLTHNNILTNMRGALKVMQVSTNDILFSILPPFHSFGFILGLLGIFGGIKTAFFPDPTDGRHLAKAFEKWKITIICGAPTFLKGMFRSATPEQIKTLRLCVSGAEKAPQDLLALLEKFGKLDTFAEGYGITECSPVLTITATGKPLVGVGEPLPEVELLITHPETDAVLSTGQQGNILARGPNIFKGYLGKGTSNPFVTAQGKQWYKTGDLGFIDANGNLTITGRLKRFIKIGGEMISLAAIETALQEMAMKMGWSASEEGPLLAICAKEIPNERTKIVLFSRFEATQDDVNRFLKEAGFSNLVKVTEVVQLPEIPLMGTGKINYRALEAQHFG